MLAVSPSVGYIHEPFNPVRRAGVCAAPISKWFTYICEENEREYYPGIKETLEFHFRASGQWRNIASVRAAAGTARACGNFLRYRFLGKRPLLKAPMAVFSTPWLAERFDAKVVLLVRHPAAVVSSLKLLNGTIPVAKMLSDIREQPLLIRDHLQPFEEEIKHLTPQPEDILGQAALLWKLVYHVVWKYKRQHPEWIVLRHVDLANDPLNGFGRVFQQLDLPCGKRETVRLQKFCFAQDHGDPTLENPWTIRRNSPATPTYWKNRLTPEEIARVRSQVEEISQHFYTDDDW